MRQAAESLREQRARNETLTRLSAPQHIVQNHFSQHRRVEGYDQDRSVKDFYGCDRLWKLDTVYGTIQMGYDPRRGQSFLFANRKTSILDTAESSHERRLWEANMMRAQKTGNENVAYGSRRRAGSAVLLFKAENKPWTEASLAPYLHRVNMETLRTTMPFLDRQNETKQREENTAAQRALQQDLRARMLAREYAAMAGVRARQMNLLREEEQISAVLVRKAQQSLLFFRKINMAFDLQKAKMFAYYRAERSRRAKAAGAPVSAAQGEAENRDGKLPKQR